MNKKGCEGNRDSNPNPPWAHTLDFAVILANVNWCRCSFKTLFAENTLRSGKKNTRWVSFIYPWVMRIFKQQSQWIVGYTQGTVSVDSNNVEIRYSLRQCGRWRSYDAIFFWLKLEWVYSKRYAKRPEAQDILYANTCWCIDAIVSCIMWCNLRQWLNINNFSLMNQIKFDHHWCEIMLQQLNVLGDSCESTQYVKEMLKKRRIFWV